MNINFISIIVLVLSALIGFGGSIVVNKLYHDTEDKAVKVKIILKSIALFGIIAALLISIYF